MPIYFHRPGKLPHTAHKNLHYKVVLYRNHKQRKVMYQSRTIYPARKKYLQYLENNRTIFPIKWDAFGKPVQYELLLLGNWGDKMTKYKAPSGVVYDVNLAANDGLFIKDIQPYYIEEKFKHYNTQKVIIFKDVAKLMMGEVYSKILFPFNNKLYLEIVEKDEIHLFILKNKADAERLYQTIKNFYYQNRLTDCFFFTKPMRGTELSELYERISSKLGISRYELKKTSTKV
jgi:hypothetical protein